MNRTILIVICDFLLVSLLAFSTVDINKVSEEGTPRNVKIDIATNQVVESGKDLAAVMRLALDEERRTRDELMGELTRARETANRQQVALSDREKQVQTFQQELQNREQQVQTVQQQLQSREQQVQTFQQELQNREQQLQTFTQQVQQVQQQLLTSQQQLQAREQQLQTFQQQLQTREQEAQRLKELQAGLQQQYAAAQTNIQTLSQQVQSSSTDALISKERMSALQAELASLQKSNQAVLAEQQRLAGQLQVAEVERRHAAEQVTAMKEQVKVERAEKEKLSQQATQLAEGVKVLANKSGELAEEVRVSRPLAANTIFNEFSTNRVAARFSATRAGLLGDANRSRDTDTVLVSDGTNTFALAHVQDTPLTLFNPGTDWDQLTGSLSRLRTTLPVRSLCFYLYDPRLVFIPLTQAEVRQLGAKVYRVSSDPYKYQDAVLIGAREGYYGECRFQIDLGTREYVKLDKTFLGGLFGKFNPSRGDLVFSKTGELLGVMANDSYCLMIRDFSPAASFRFGQDLRAQRTGMILSHLYTIVAGLPPKLQ